ncbi:class I SAM-dependent methyltransferase [Nocardia carnea]|uniref:class I SAM-dependent methyltransferase n=1 Tax=Nocardia carnea TaxID=37328 RepID=UPI002453AB6A|nr:class I SAM-dependent methyltransferase [Nocardia carnea]
MPQRAIRRPVFARAYAGLAGPALERAGAGEYRRRLWAGLSGRVLEVGAGYGANFAYIPSEVERVIAVEPEPRLREQAQAAADGLDVAMEVVDGAAEALPVPDGSVDAVVWCLTLCSVADPAAALAETRRVLAPGGVVRFFEHGRSQSPGMRRVQRVLDATVWPVFNGGCHTGRDHPAALVAAGFEITEVERFVFPPMRFPFPGGEHMLGTAVANGEGRR